MTEQDIGEETLKRVFKEAIVEVLDERRELLRDLLEDILLNFDPDDGIRDVRELEGRNSSGLFAHNEAEA